MIKVIKHYSYEITSSLFEQIIFKENYSFEPLDYLVEGKWLRGERYLGSPWGNGEGELQEEIGASKTIKA